ncbi:MAG: ABC transporter ATP-binding protein [Candidatus Thermoplasmatota archaeon]|nr:ABC transporter ATP-binding protein [Euryarchaeota archaeon]MBU4031635.1 ABC transporter ATP-binding protein [Candidatus Thermoplasmatota archaeon]MBU4071709.1 ABC transporter ATP-binding protein [Candidatus Thermoplasmatota archaeon]MBU4143788.1 ABC transporter ATP-binding protein [Candidatus Thermoplasmatota archaeon]MBU4591378.1 ABC transporter ATP-binding protein [Candidatus Thermoplasmatota archaeon]
MNEIMVEATNLTKTYKTGQVEVHALRGVDITVRKGDMIAIMGPSGCGKTTLLNLLSGLDDVTSGTVKIEGKDLSQMTDNKKTEHRARRMGFIFQFYNLLPVLSAIENVEMPLLVSGTSAKEAREQAIEIMNVVGLGEVMYSKPGALSGGERQRTTIARALISKPAIIWGDELTGDLDDETANNIMDLVARLRKETQATFVIVTHNPEVGKRADKILYMRSGQFVREEVNVPPKDKKV